MDYSLKDNEYYARLAWEEEIKASLLKVNLKDEVLSSGGIPLYADSDAVYIDKTDTHSLIMGSTGAGKSRRISMPTTQILAKAGESFIVTDPKAELYERSFPLLKKLGYDVLVLNLRDPLQSNSWNPLFLPYRYYRSGEYDQAIALVTDMADCITKTATADYWEGCASDLLAGLIFILFECAEENEIHLKSLRALKAQAFRTVEGIRDTPFIRDKFFCHLDPRTFVYSKLSGTVEVCEETRSCIKSVFDEKLRPFFSYDNLIDTLSGNDLDMRAIGNKKTAVFLIIPDETNLYNRLVSIFVKQCYSELLNEAQKQPTKRLPIRVNYLLDEFGNFPKISDFSNMIAAARSRNIRFVIMIQSFSQLIRKYGENCETIKCNCENWVYLHSKELSLLNELIELGGRKNNDEPLLTIPFLLGLNKEKGESLVFHKRLHPYVARLPDIDSYSMNMADMIPIQYPQNIQKVEAVFNFERYCMRHSDGSLSKLFNGKGRIEDELTEEDYLASDELITEPIYTSRIPSDLE